MNRRRSHAWCAVISLGWMLALVARTTAASHDQRPTMQQPPAQAAVKTGAKGDAAKGKEVFEQCAACHSVTDAVQGKKGRGLKGLYKWAKLPSGRAVTDATVLAVIDEGGNGMPGYKDMMSGAEKANLLAYLRIL